MALYDTICKLSNITSHPKFAYAMVKNKQLIEPEYKAILSLYIYGDKYKKYDKERLKLIDKYGSRDSSNELIITNGSVMFSNENLTKFENEISILKNEYTEVLTQVETINSEVNKILNETIDINIHKINIDYVPDQIKIGDMEILEVLIDS